MSPEAEHLITDYSLETVYKAHGHNHDGHADGGGGYGQPDDEFGKGLLPVKGDSPGYEYRYIQSAYIWYLTKVFI